MVSLKTTIFTKTALSRRLLRFHQPGDAVYIYIYIYMQQWCLFLSRFISTELRFLRTNWTRWHCRQDEEVSGIGLAEHDKWNCRKLQASPGKSCSHRRRIKSCSAARRLKHGSVQQRLKNGSEQLQGENGQPFEVNETRENYDAAVHGYTCFVTNSPLVC